MRLAESQSLSQLPEVVVIGITPLPGTAAPFEAFLGLRLTL